MAEVRTIEEYVRGPDGDDSKALGVTLQRVKRDAEAADVERIRCECRTTPLGSSQSRSEWSTTFQTKDPVPALLDALTTRLESSPGEVFSGELRLNFKVHGSSQHIGSYTRKMRPGISNELVGPNGEAVKGELAGDLLQVRAHFDNLVKPLSDQHIALIHATTGLVQASAQVLQASHGPVQAAPGSNGNMVHDLLRGAINIATAGDQADQRARAGQQQPNGHGAIPAQVIRVGGTLSPPGPPGMPRQRLAPPKPGAYDQPRQIEGREQKRLPGPVASPAAAAAPRPITRADVEQWAKENEQEATGMVLGLLDERGMTITPKT